MTPAFRDLPSLLMITGLPASGKSRLVKTRREQFLNGGCAPFVREDWPGWHQAHQSSREELVEQLLSGTPAIIDSSGFCYTEALEAVRREVRDRTSGVTWTIEYFDNNPLACIRLALADMRKRFHGNGALARVAQIVRDAPVYKPDPSLGVIHPVSPEVRLVGYDPEVCSATRELLDQIEDVLSTSEGLMGGADFHAMPESEHCHLIASVTGLIKEFKATN
jgi:hypothetical protein